MSIMTNQREYDLTVVSSPLGGLFYQSVRFRYPQSLMAKVLSWPQKSRIDQHYPFFNKNGSPHREPAFLVGPLRVALSGRCADTR
jgi:hypothetical protein